MARSNRGTLDSSAQAPAKHIAFHGWLSLIMMASVVAIAPSVHEPEQRT